MSTNVTTAVTDVTPKKSRAPRTVAAAAAPATVTATVTSIARKGRAPVVLKGGILLADARKNARDGINAAKDVLRNAKGALVAAEKEQKAQQKLVDGIGKQITLANAALAKAPKDAALKQRVKDLQGDFKRAAAELKFRTKTVDVAKKAIDKANIGVDKAQAAAQKVEDQYKAVQAKAA